MIVFPLYRSSYHLIIEEAIWLFRIRADFDARGRYSYDVRSFHEWSTNEKQKVHLMSPNTKKKTKTETKTKTKAETKTDSKSETKTKTKTKTKAKAKTRSKCKSKSKNKTLQYYISKYLMFRVFPWNHL
jgi:hypothetical protein